MPRWNNTNGTAPSKLIVPAAVQIVVGLAPLFLSAIPDALIGPLSSQPFYREQVQSLPEILERFKQGSLMTIPAALLMVWLNRGQTYAVSILSGLTLFLLVAVRTLQFPFGCDDAHHDYRYAMNWSQGKGFDYNPGEHIMGFTSHLHVLLLAGVSILTRCVNATLLSPLLNIFLQATAAILLYFLTLRRLKRATLALVAMATYALNPYLIVEVWTGKETSLVTLLMIISFYCLLAKRWNSFAATSCALFLTRPEGIFWLLLAMVWTGRRIGLKKTIWHWSCPLLLTGSYYIFLFAYFGTVIPHGAIGRAHMFHTRFIPDDWALSYALSMLGKTTFGNIFMPLLLPIDAVLRHLGAMPERLAQCHYFAYSLNGALAMLCLMCFSRRRDYLRFYCLAVSSILLFHVLIDTWQYSWYFCWFSIMPSLLIPLLVAKMWALPKKLKLSLLPSFGVKAFCIYIVLGAVLCLRFLFQWDDSQARLTQYRRAAAAVANLSLVPKMVATIEPGVIGYYYRDGHILDIGGLLSEQPLRYLPVPCNQRTDKPVWASIPPNCINEMKPDCLVTLDCFASNGLFKDRQFLRDYKLVYFAPTPVWSSHGMFIFVRWTGRPK